jgi:hypothetical protein
MRCALLPRSSFIRPAGILIFNRLQPPSTLRKQLQKE